MDKKFMMLAIDEASRGMNSGDGGPFGAVIVRDDEVLSSAHNSVLIDKNATRHAEINAISIASEKLDTYDLSGCELYTTTEPCPMCFSAIHWARIDKIYFGTTIEDVHRLGFNELSVKASAMKTIGRSTVKIVEGFLKDECLQLLKAWQELPEKEVY